MRTENLFSILIGLGATLGLWRVYSTLHARQKIRGLGIGLWVLIGGLLGARTGFVLMHLHYYSLHPGESVKFWQGGMSGFGAFAGAVLFSIIAARVLHMQTLKTLDRMSCLILPLGVMSWLGCWTAGTAYGPTLEPGTWWGMATLDETGLSSLRVPLQPMAAISLFVIIYILELKIPHLNNGILFAGTGLGISLHSLLFSFFRADPVQAVFGLRLDSMLALISSVCFAVFIIILIKRVLIKDKMKKDDIVQEAVV